MPGQHRLLRSPRWATLGTLGTASPPVSTAPGEKPQVPLTVGHFPWKMLCPDHELLGFVSRLKNPSGFPCMRPHDGAPRLRSSYKGKNPHLPRLPQSLVD